MDSRDSPPVEELLAHTGFVRSLARRAIGRDDGSEDLVQEAMLTALERGPQEPRAARSWFYRVVTNRVATLRRRDAVRGRYLRQRQASPAPAVPSPADILAREESRRQLVRALLQLDPMYREPLVLRYYEDLPPRKIAKRLDLPVETVRTRLKRGVALLRTALDAQYGSRRTWMIALLPLTRLPRGDGALPVSAADTMLTSITSKSAIASLVAVPTLVGAVALGVRFYGRRPAPVEAPPIQAPPAATHAVLTGTSPSSHGGRVQVDSPRATAGEKSAHGRTFTIRVLDYTGLPVPGAEVRVSEDRRDFVYDREAVRGRTDDEGCLSVPRTAKPPTEANIPTSAFRLQITQPHHREDLQLLEVEDWQPDDATFTLARGFVISGEVTSREGHPVPGARVHLRAEARERSVETDRHGRFRAAGLPDARWRARIDLHRVPGDVERGEWVLDSGSRGVRLELTAGRPLLIELPFFNARKPSHRALDLQVTEHDPGSGAATARSSHPISPNGLIWLYGLSEEKLYTLWWGPVSQGRFAHASNVNPTTGPVALRLREGRSLCIHVVRPVGWEGWPDIRATARGIEVFGNWHEDGDYVIEGLPDGEFLVEAQGRDSRGREVHGEVRARTGGEATLRLSLR